jgi:hypothetical protein
VLSGKGGYMEEPSGRLRWNFGFAISDIFVWQPYWGRGYYMVDLSKRDEWNGDVLGFLFKPLMTLDQRFIHPNLRFRSLDDGSFLRESLPPKSKMHPKRM